jgi:hypothetical protein
VYPRSARHCHCEKSVWGHADMTVACPPLPAPSIWLLAETRPAIQRTAPPLHSKSPQPIISVRHSSFRCRIPVGLLRVRRLSLAMAFTGLPTHRKQTWPKLRCRCSLSSFLLPCVRICYDRLQAITWRRYRSRMLSTRPLCRPSAGRPSAPSGLAIGQRESRPQASPITL